MESYLRNVKQSLSAIEHKKVIHIVMGNESCDLDSCISSIVYAYLLNISKCHSDDCLVIPIMNTKRSLLRLKTEVIYWIQNVLNIDPHLLVCKDDLDLHKLQAESRQVLITLVDHNINSELEQIGSLSEIIDHHQETRSLSRPNDVKVEIDTSVGSCCTLVARRYINYCTENEFKVDEQISLLLYGPIILDTICFSNDARRYNELDLQIAKQIELILTEKSVTRDDIYSQLINAKNSISTLTFREILYKDMKLVQFDDCKAITSSISGQLVGNLILSEQQNHILNDLSEISKEQNYSLILLMGITTKLNSIQRDMAIYSPNDNLLKKVTQTLFNHNNKELDLCIVESKSNLIVLSQRNVQASRKVILPVIEELFRSEQFIADWNSGAFSSSRAITPDVDRLQSNDPPQLIPETKTTSGRSNEGKLLNGQVMRSTSVESTSSTAGKLMGDGRPPDSINYYGSDYGSYFMDSYVGELVGDVAEDKLAEEQIDELNWCDDQRIENALEFGFDSFGPESILFQTTNGDSSITNGVKKLETIKESSEKGDSRYRSKDYTNEKIRLDDEELNARKAKKSNNHLIANTDEDYEDLVSLSVAEPQLKQKLDTCFDANKIRNGYDITAEPKSILALDRSLSDCLNEYDEENYDREEFDRELDRQFKNELHRQSYDRVLKRQNKSSDSQVEGFRLNSESPINDLEDENFNSLIEASQIKKSKDNNQLDILYDAQQVEQCNEDDESNSIENDDNLSAQLPDNDSAIETMDDISDRTNLTSTTANTSHTITNLSIDDKTLTDETQFKRQSTLTQSQRRRITPKYKFEEMPSSADTDLFEHITKQQQQNQLQSIPLNDNHLSTLDYPQALTNSQSDHLKSGCTSRASTLPKKKIVADFKEDSHEDSSNGRLENLLPSKDHQSTQNTQTTQQSYRPNMQQTSTPSSTNVRLMPFSDQGPKSIDNLRNEMRKIGLDDDVNHNEHDYENAPNWQESCPIGRVGEIKKIDMKVIEPYARVISHAGYYTNGSESQAIGDSNSPAIILFSSCYLPDRTRRDYDYVMDNLFMYVLTTLHQLIANEYIMIYFHNAGCGANTSANNMPTFTFLRRCYFLIDRKLRKSLKALYLVHPTLWLKSIVIMSKPFINTKFSKKLKFVNNLSDLNHLVPVDLKIIPDPVKQTDEVIERRKRRN